MSEQTHNGAETLTSWTCPRCDLVRPPQWRALSRMDNETYICNPCGDDEAMRDHLGDPPVPVDEWPILTEDGLRELLT